MIEKNIQNVIASQLQLTCTQHSCMPTLTKHCFAELCEDEVWKLHKAVHGYRKAPKLWPQHVGTLLESLNFSPLQKDPSSSRNAELDIMIFIHVDDGLLFVPSIELQRQIEHFVDSIDDAHCGTTGSAGRSNILSWQSAWENSSWILGRSESEVHPRRDCCAWPGGLGT